MKVTTMGRISGKKAAAGAALALLCAWMGAASLSADTLFDCNFNNCVTQSMTTLANLNSGAAVGSWSGFDDARVNDPQAPSTGIWPNSAGTLRALLMDRDSTLSAGFSLDANLTSAADLASGATVVFKTSPRRTGAGKSAVFSGLDASGNVSFMARLYVDTNTQVFQYTTDGTNWTRCNPDTSQLIESKNMNAQPTIDMTTLETVTLTLSGSSYVFGYTPGPSSSPETTAAYTSATINYVNTPAAPTSLKKIRFEGNTQTGVWIDEVLVTGTPASSVQDWDKQ